MKVGGDMIREEIWALLCLRLKHSCSKVNEPLS